MAAFDFPSSPSVNQTYTANGVTWKWNGTMWMRVSGAGYLEKIEEGNSKIEVDDSGSGNITATTDGTEALRITSTGVINCGHGDAINLHGSTTTGINLNGNNNSGQIIANASNNRALIIGRQANYGQVIEFFQGTNINEAAITIPAADSFGIETAGTERLRIASDGVITGRGELRLTEGTSSVSNGDEIGSLMFTYPSNDNKNAKIVALKNAGTSGADLAFFTRTHGDGTNNDGGEERLRINSSGHMRLYSGDLRVGDDTDSNAGTQTISVGSVSSGSGGIGIFANPTNGNSFVQFGDGTSSADQYRGYMNYQHASDTLFFGTAGTTKLSITSNGATLMHVNSASHETFRFTTQNVNEAKLIMKDASNNDDIVLNTGGDSWVNGGDFGIGTASPSSDGGRTLEVYDATTPTLRLNHNNAYKSLFQLRGNDLEIRGSNGQLEFYTGNADGASSSLRGAITSAGHKWTHNGSIFHGSNDVTDFTDANRDTYNNVTIRAGRHNAGTSPTNDNSAIKIYPAGNRSTTIGNLTGGIAWQHLDPSNGSWGSSYGAGAQIWMGAALHDVPGQERDRFNLWMNSQTAGNSQPNNLAIEAYPNGMVRHPKNPAFMVRNSTSNNAFSANARATWDTTLLNNGSHFDLTNNIFTAPIDGIYNFTCMMLSNANTRLFHCFRVNNTIIDGTRSEGHAVSGSYATYTITMTYSLSANDYVDVYVRNNNAYGGVYTNFNGFLVG